MQCEQTDQNNLWDDTIYEPLLRNETDLSDVAQTSLYYLIGALLFKIKKNFKHCDQCFNTLLRGYTYLKFFFIGLNNVKTSQK